MTRPNPDLTPTEQKVSALWNEILETQLPLTPSDNFFSLGGDSLAMTLVLFRVNELYRVELPAAALLESPELGAFSACLDAAVREMERPEWNRSA